MANPHSLVPTLELVKPGRPGRFFPIKGEDLHIGRVPGFDVYLSDGKVSRNHARIERRSDGSCHLVDLGSHNGTYLDGKILSPFQPAPLHEGSRIRVVEFELVFHNHEVQLCEDVAGGSSVVGAISDLSSSHLAARSARPGETLQAVLEVNRALGGGADLDEVIGRALDGLITAFPRAGCGFILTSEPDGTLSTRAIRDRHGSVRPPTLSRTVLRMVLQEGKAVRIADMAADERFKDAPSLIDAGVLSALCVPLTDHEGRSIGLIQLESRSRTGGFAAEDLDQLAALAVPVGVAVENHQLLKERASWAAARLIQTALLPRRRPEAPGYAFWDYYRPAEEVGGDLYDYISIRPDVALAGADWTRWAVSVGDVAGKGMCAALMMASICPEVRHLARAGVDPHEVLARVNRHVYDAEVEGRFVTLALAELDTRGHRMRVFNAGHTDPIVRRAGGRVDVVGRVGSGPPLGAAPDSAYGADKVTLGPGDVVILYTDGVTEAMDRDGRMFGEEGLLRTVAGAPEGVAQLGEAIVAAVRRHAVGRPQFDDITLVCFGRDPG